jgi:hypothetical protein
LPFIFGCTRHRTVYVPVLLNVTVNFGGLPFTAPELTVLEPLKTLPPDGPSAAGLSWRSGVTPPHQ